MRTVIIDRSLCEFPFAGLGSSPLLEDYVEALFQSGVDYIEMDLDSLATIRHIENADKFIFHLSSREELFVLDEFNFAYVTVPLGLSFLIPSLHTPVILEIHTGSVSLMDLISIIASNVDFKRVSMIRIIGDFEFLGENLESFIRQYRLHYPIPLDICPLNESLTALMYTLEAYKHHADAVTVAFGDDKHHAALENFLISLYSMYQITHSKDYIMGICKAAVHYNMLTNSVSKGIQNLLDRYANTAHQEVVNIDFPSQRYLNPKSYSYSKKKQTTYLDKRFEELGLEYEVAQTVKEILKDCDVHISRTLKKAKKQC